MNRLYYGDNLDVLRRHVENESVDLVYLDPPFNSNASYNVLFAERDGTQAASQIKAFEDTWRWDEGAARAFEEVVESGGRVSQAMQAFRTLLGDTDMLAYLAMMAPRLVELRRVLKPAGSIYLHCDDTASHYLKLLLDAVFSPKYFRAAIVWKRTTAHNDARRTFGDVVDIILYYVKTDAATFNRQFGAYDQTYLDSKYRHLDASGRRYRLSDLRSPHPRPNLTYDYKGHKPHPNGWALSLDRMKELDKLGRLEFPKKQGGRIQLRRYLDERSGMPVSNVWDDIRPVNAMAQERLGYPTQKPEALLERIISASSNEGDIVLDPFCGCGTTIASAQRLKRRWVGIDITNLAIGLIRHRLRDAYGEDIAMSYDVIGEPVSVADAATLAASDPYQFQWWALGLVGARPAEGKKGADQGIDGRIYFHEGDTAKTHQVILSVKAGRLHAPYVRDLRGVVEREKAAIGVLLALDEPTKGMRTEAASAGFYKSPWGSHPKLQIVTVAELLEGKRLDIPPVRQTSVTFKRAPKAAAKTAERQELDFGESEEVDVDVIDTRVAKASKKRPRR